MERTGGYIAENMMDEVCDALKKGGCHSVHIGGGEPFMDFEALLQLLQKLNRSGIAVDYIETNAYWASDESQMKERLTRLSAVGVDALCISIDPFHAEYIPLRLPLNLANHCRHLGFGYFLWQERFLPMLKNVDPNHSHDRAALEKNISPKYIHDTSQAYGLRMGGRAINIEEEYAMRKPFEHFLVSEPCRGLLSVNHFHIDMYGKFIPPGCTGFAIPMNEMLDGLPAGKYPVFEILLTKGAKGLADYAIEKGFTPDSQGYTSRCALCFHVRHWLSKHGECPELDLEHYEHSLLYYDK